MARKSGENVGNEDAYLEPTSLTRSGREAGAWVYLDAHTLKTALREAHIPEDTPVGDLEVIRHVLRKGGKDAQVILKIRVIEPVVLKDTPPDDILQAQKDALERTFGKPPAGA